MVVITEMIILDQKGDYDSCVVPYENFLKRGCQTHTWGCSTHMYTTLGYICPVQTVTAQSTHSLFMKVNTFSQEYCAQPLRSGE